MPEAIGQLAARTVVDVAECVGLGVLLTHNGGGAAVAVRMVWSERLL